MGMRVMAVHLVSSLHALFLKVLGSISLLLFSHVLVVLDLLPFSFASSPESGAVASVVVRRMWMRVRTRSWVGMRSMSAVQSLRLLHAALLKSLGLVGFLFFGHVRSHDFLPFGLATVPQVGAVLARMGMRARVRRSRMRPVGVSTFTTTMVGLAMSSLSFLGPLSLEGLNLGHLFFLGKSLVSHKLLEGSLELFGKSHTFLRALSLKEHRKLLVHAFATMSSLGLFHASFLKSLNLGSFLVLRKGFVSHDFFPGSFASFHDLFALS